MKYSDLRDALADRGISLMEVSSAYDVAQNHEEFDTILRGGLSADLVRSETRRVCARLSGSVITSSRSRGSDMAGQSDVARRGAGLAGLFDLTSGEEGFAEGSLEEQGLHLREEFFAAVELGGARLEFTETLAFGKSGAARVDVGVDLHSGEIAFEATGAFAQIVFPAFEDAAFLFEALLELGEFLASEVDLAFAAGEIGDVAFAGGEAVEGAEEGDGGVEIAGADGGIGGAEDASELRGGDVLVDEIAQAAAESGDDGGEAGVGIEKDAVVDADAEADGLHLGAGGGVALVVHAPGVEDEEVDATRGGGGGIGSELMLEVLDGEGAVFVAGEENDFHGADGSGTGRRARSIPAWTRAASKRASRRRGSVTT